MSLTKGRGPLAPHAPHTVNYRVEGPAHKLLAEPFPRRVRATVAGATVFDTERGMLVHETALHPVLYVPREDVATELLEPSATRTHCPFKGDATHWTLRIGEHRVPDAAWEYPEPLEAASWLRGHLAFYWDRLEHWYDELEEVFAHLRNPYTRVDTRRSSRRVRVRAGAAVIAETERAVILSETGHPNRIYVPAEDVRQELLRASETRTHCPYKGWASYWTVAVDGAEYADAAWSYEEPFPESLQVRGHLCFDLAGDEVEVEVR
jgi:uncharacterized protein (DUF427 family)